MLYYPYQIYCLCITMYIHWQYLQIHLHFNNLYILRWNMHTIETYLMSTPQDGCVKYLFQNKISKSIMVFFQLEGFLYNDTVNMVHKSVIIIKCTCLCPFSTFFKISEYDQDHNHTLRTNQSIVIEDRCYGGIATCRCYGGIVTCGHFTFHKLATIDYDCYSLIFISYKPPQKQIHVWLLSTFRDACFINVGITEAYGLTFW